MRHRLVLSTLAAGLVLGGTAAGAAAGANPPASTAARCPQPRHSEAAPPSYAARVNPLARTAANLDRGRRLFQSAQPMGCTGCHGASGNGRGPDAAGLVPPPRDFTCAQTMMGLSDGQLYWVIENGSGQLHLPSRQGAQQIARPGRGGPRSTAMLAYGEYLTETDIWQLVLHIRTLSAKSEPKAKTP